MKTALPVLIALAAPLGAQSPAIQGGGEIVIAGTPYRFESSSLMASTQPVRGNQALKLKGRLIPADSASALDLELVTLGDREIYLLSLVNDEGKAGLIRWSANLKTRIEVTAPGHPKDGDRATFHVEGPLLRMDGGKAKPYAWSGTFWPVFSVEQAP